MLLALTGMDVSGTITNPLHMEHMPNVEPSFVLYALLLEPGGCLRAHITLFELVEPEGKKNNQPPSPCTMSIDQIADHLAARLTTVTDVWYVVVRPPQLSAAHTRPDGHREYLCMSSSFGGRFVRW